MVDHGYKKVYNKWVLTQTLWPKTCFVSGKPIPMFSKAYLLQNGDITAETWALPNEFIMARLKGKI